MLKLQQQINMLTARNQQLEDTSQSISQDKPKLDSVEKELEMAKHQAQSYEELATNMTENTTEKALKKRDQELEE